MHFVVTITIIITRPFTAPMTDGGVRTRHILEAAPLIGVALRAWPGELFEVIVQGRLVSRRHHAQPTLPRVAAHCADERGTIVGILMQGLRAQQPR